LSVPSEKQQLNCFKDYLKQIKKEGLNGHALIPNRIQIPKPQKLINEKVFFLVFDFEEPTKFLLTKKIAVDNISLSIDLE
jgi:hypothetical protein